MYSALKQDGKKLYELARSGKTVERKARRITIYELKLLGKHKDTLELEVFCSKGTYIRSLAEDIGEGIGCGATVKALRRIQSGLFSIAQAKTLEQLQEMDDQNHMEILLAVDLPLSSLPSVELNHQQSVAINYGQSVDVIPNAQGPVRMYGPDQFLGLGEMRLDGKLLPKKLFNLNE